jgi:endoglucanase
MKILSKLFAVFTAAVVSVTAAVIPVSAEESAVTLPDSEALRFVDSLGAGWNLGNAFDAIDCTWLTDTLDYEFGWCQVKTAKDLIKAVKNAGFSSIRIPVSWHNHVDKNNNIDAAWLDRVKEVVDWSLGEGLYVIVNIHHDDDSGYYPDSAHLDNSLKYVKSIWKQVAEKFRSYDERLVFEPLNEPNLSGTPYEWWWSDANNPPAEVVDSMNCINKLQQAAVDSIRAAGGKNADRYILIAAYAGKNDISGVLSPYYKLPTDSAKNKLIVDCHFYGKNTSVAHSVLDGLYKAYVSKGTAVAVTEYGLTEEGDANYACDSDEYVKTMKDFYSYARSRGISVFIWDDNGNLRLYDRAAKKWNCPKIVKAITEAGKPAIAKIAAPEIKAAASKTKVKLSWSKQEGASKYAVYQYKNGKFVKVKTVTGTSATIKSLKSGKTYKFKVMAYVGGKWQDHGDALKVTTKK